MVFINNDNNYACPNCKLVMSKTNLNKKLNICNNCNYYFRLNARERIELIADPKSFKELFLNVAPKDHLSFPNYKEKLQEYQKLTNETDAFVSGECKIGGFWVSIGVLFSQFMMGSMSTAVGEKLTMLIKHSRFKKIPLILFTASGGARMQEGILALMQMVKVSSALKTYSNEKNLYISILTDPTTGGVAASFAYQGDYIIAERGALIGFSGKRVIKQTINKELPEYFQTAEFQQENGFLDLIVGREDLKQTIIEILRFH